MTTRPVPDIEMSTVLTLICASLCIINGTVIFAVAHRAGDGLREIQALTWLILGAIILK